MFHFGASAQTEENRRLSSFEDSLSFALGIESIEENDRKFWENVHENHDVEQIGDSKVYVETIEEGEGDHPAFDSDIKVYYVATNAFGDTLVNAMSNAPLLINLGSVIQGWTIAFPSLQKGGKYRLFIPWEKAYKNVNAELPQGALCFYVELIDFGPKGTIAKQIPSIVRRKHE